MSVQNSYKVDSCIEIAGLITTLKIRSTEERTSFIVDKRSFIKDFKVETAINVHQTLALFRKN